MALPFLLFLSVSAVPNVVLCQDGNSNPGKEVRYRLFSYFHTIYYFQILQGALTFNAAHEIRFCYSVIEWLKIGGED